MSKQLNEREGCLPCSARSRQLCGKIVNSAWLRLLIVLLVLCDAAMLIAETAIPGEVRVLCLCVKFKLRFTRQDINDKAVDSVTIILLIVLFLESLLRLVFMDCKAYFRDAWCASVPNRPWLTMFAGACSNCWSRWRPWSCATRCCNCGRRLTRHHAVQLAHVV